MTPPQRALLDAWLPGWTQVHDHSWHLVGTTVLEVEHDGVRLVVKAAGEGDGHLPREVRPTGSGPGRGGPPGTRPRCCTPTSTPA